MRVLTTFLDQAFPAAEIAVLYAEMANRNRVHEFGEDGPRSPPGVARPVPGPDAGQVDHEGQPPGGWGQVMKLGFQYVLGWWNRGFTTSRRVPGARIAVLAVPVLQKSGSWPP
jgi:hypothetical protein